MPVTYSQYGGFYHFMRPDGSIVVNEPGTDRVLVILPDLELFTNFADQCNIAFTNLTPGLALHLTGCKRCKKFVEANFPMDEELGSPCKLGAQMFSEAKGLTAQICKKMAQEYLDYAKSRLQDNVDSSVAEGTP